jgi:tryptophanyl-tRNA synthetase
LVLETPKTVTKKIKSAVTDSGSEVRRGDGKENEPDPDPRRRLDHGGRGESGSTAPDTATTGAVAEAVDFLAPVRERYEELRPDEVALESTLEAGADKARAIASQTLAEVRSAIGVGPK